MASTPADKSHGGDGDERRMVDAKCKWCRKARRMRCVKPPGASRCTRCESLGLLCITQINVGASESDGEQLTPGEYCREILRPTTLHKTRLAITQLTEDLSQLQVGGGQVPDHVLGILGVAMVRARAANNLALLHSAVSMNAALNMNSSIGSLANEGDVEADACAASQRQRCEALLAEGKEYITQRLALDGIQLDGLAQVRQVMYPGVSEVTCNELFKCTFFDVADKAINALYFDLSVALVDDESKEALKALDEEVAHQSLYSAAPRSPSGMRHCTATSDAPLVLIGRTGERLTAKLRTDNVWPPDGSFTLVHVSLVGLRTGRGTDADGNPRQVAAASTGEECCGWPLQQEYSERYDAQEHEQLEWSFESLTTPDASETKEVSAPDNGGGVDDSDIDFLCSVLLENGAAERGSQQP